MGIKFLVLAGGILAIVALFGATNAFATPPAAYCTTTDFRVDVKMQNADGMTNYEYTLSSPTGANPNKFFVYVKGRQSDGQGLQGDLHGTIGESDAGSYVPNGGSAAANCPPSAAWTFNKDDDGYCFPNVAISNQPTLTVSERYKPEEGTSMAIIGKSNTVQICGPILGPTTAAAPKFEGTPLFDSLTRQVFQNGCAYFVGANPVTHLVTSMTPDPATPFETIGPGAGAVACVVIPIEAGVCEQETGLVHCSITPVGGDPMQSQEGGTCFYPPNKKFTC